MACAEFAAAGKPIFAWRHAPERHHLDKFCTQKLGYSTARELDLVLRNVSHEELIIMGDLNVDMGRLEDRWLMDIIEVIEILECPGCNAIDISIYWND